MKPSGLDVHGSTMDATMGHTRHTNMEAGLHIRRKGVAGSTRMVGGMGKAGTLRHNTGIG